MSLSTSCDKLFARMFPISAVTESVSPPIRVVNVAESNPIVDMDSTFAPGVLLTLALVPKLVLEPNERDDLPPELLLRVKVVFLIELTISPGTISGSAICAYAFLLTNSRLQRLAIMTTSTG